MKTALGVLGVAALLTILASDAHAHIGSPNVYFTGDAGPYPVRVVIRPPLALPGRAEVNVTVEDGPVSEVRLLAAPPGVPAETLPVPEVARPVAGAAGLHAAELWIMVPGAYGVRVAVSGPRGTGETVVPLNAVNQAPAAMAPWLRASLAVLGVLLGGGTVLIASAAARESALPPGAAPAVADIRRGTVAGAVAAAAVIAVTVLGLAVWRRMDRDYRTNQLFKPLPVAAQSSVVGAGRIVILRPMPDERGRAEWPPLVTDHGKLMHLFLVREPELDAFAHVHPRPEGGDFVVAVPPLPGGVYRIYADVTLESGLSQTLTTTVTLPPTPPAGAGADPDMVPDPDDSWHLSAASPGAATTVPLQRGYRMAWKNPEAVRRAGESRLEFEVTGPEGRPARLHDYMGMMGHAAVRREDGTVFAHLHPTGSISMASQMLFEAGSAPPGGGEPAPAVDHSAHMGHDEAATSRVAFPYAFPKPGSYRIWVQVKPDDTVMTAVFDAQVTAADSD